MNDNTSPLHRLTAFTKLTDREMLHLARLTRPVRKLDQKAVIIEEGDSSPQCFLLLSGWVGGYSTSRTGRRTMTRIYMAGDLLGNTSLPLNEFAETLVTLCPCSVASISARAIGSLFEAHPRVASILYLVAQEERVRQMDWVTSLLRLDAAGRIAALFLDLFERHITISPQAEHAMPFYLSQYDVADLTGLTPTHTNRVLQQFRRDGMIDLRHHHLTLKHKEGLADLADRPSRPLATDLQWLPASAR